MYYRYSDNNIVISKYYGAYLSLYHYHYIIITILFSHYKPLSSYQLWWLIVIYSAYFKNL